MNECVLVKTGTEVTKYFDKSTSLTTTSAVLKITAAQDGYELVAFRGGKFRIKGTTTDLTEIVVSTANEYELLDDGVYILCGARPSVAFSGKVKKDSNLNAHAYHRNGVVVLEVPTQIHAQYVGVRHKGKLLTTLYVTNTTQYYALFNFNNDDDIIVYERDRNMVFFLRNTLLALFFLIVVFFLNLFAVGTSIWMVPLIVMYFGVATLFIVQPPVLNDNVWFPLISSSFALLLILQIFVLLRKNRRQ